jgi:hypothetical protein
MKVGHEYDKNINYEDYNTSYFTLLNSYLNYSLANLKQVFEKMNNAGA